MALVHHELCFGCGRANLFGLMLDLEASQPTSATGRCFIKQDHQGPQRGSAHQGVIAAALSEAMALVCGPGARAVSLEVEFEQPPPVGAFLDVVANVAHHDGDTAYATASASSDGRPVGVARGRYVAARG